MTVTAIGRRRAEGKLLGGTCSFSTAQDVVPFLRKLRNGVSTSSADRRGAASAMNTAKRGAVRAVSAAYSCSRNSDSRAMAWCVVLRALRFLEKERQARGHGQQGDMSKFSAC